ncbi:MAG: DUF2061 domain-containing protein [Bacteroidota bacterium]
MDSRKRHIAKTITWRVIASLTTFILTLIFFKEDPNATQKAIWVAVFESTSKMILYYYHERIWYLTKVKIRSSVRHLIKTVTWRVIASLTTFIIALIIFKEDAQAMQKASGIAIVETFIKMLLYYLHERVWYKQNLGLDQRKEKDE